MRLPADVLNVHHIQGELSCISWAVEFISKLHDQTPLTEYPLQTQFPKGLGFGEESQIFLDTQGIAAWEETLEWNDFEAVSKADAAIGLPLIFSFPTLVNLDFINCSFGEFGYHGAVAIHHPQIAFATRQYMNPVLIPISLQNFYTFLRTQIKPDYKMHCLRHKPKTANCL
jgi:hypothetical protein